MIWKDNGFRGGGFRPTRAHRLWQVLTPLEARSVGVPCIASTDGGVKETAGPHALFCKPGDIDALVACMEKALQMEANQYDELSRLAKVDLEQYVRPLDEYAKEYLRLIRAWWEIRTAYL